jgi:hypothetical protein
MDLEPKKLDNKSWIELDAIAGRLLEEDQKYWPHNDPRFNISNSLLRDLIVLGLQYYNQHE